MSQQEPSRILIVDDNQEIREVIHILLSGEGYETEEAADGVQALAQIRQNSFDLVILDVMMPNLNGYQTCMEIRKSSNTPILFLSARSQLEDKTLGFSSGGDDYLPKPFSYQELLSRIKALIRRYQIYQGKDATDEREGLPSQPTIEHQANGILLREAPSLGTPGSEPLHLTLHGLEIRESQRQVYKDGQEVELTDLEFSILCFLAKNRGQIFSAQRLYESIWEEPYYYGASNTVMVHIRNLRGKIEPDPHNPQIIKNVWGKGYRCE